MEPITVQAFINAPIEAVWEYWTNPDHIIKWTFASDDWHAPNATNDLVAGGKFTTRMESKDGQHGFDFGGTYMEVTPHTGITYVMEDGRMVSIDFTEENEGTVITETFDPETENPREMQRGGWQAILDNFKKYIEQSL